MALKFWTSVLASCCAVTLLAAATATPTRIITCTLLGGSGSNSAKTSYCPDGGCVCGSAANTCSPDQLTSSGVTVHWCKCGLLPTCTGIAQEQGGFWTWTTECLNSCGCDDAATTCQIAFDFPAAGQPRCLCQ